MDPFYFLEQRVLLLNAICVALGLSLSGVFNDVALELKSRESVTLTVVDAA